MAQQSQAVHTASGTGGAFWGPGDKYTFLVTGDQTADAYFVMEGLVPPGGGPPPHTHSREDETLYILDGECEVHIDDETFIASAGDFVNLPKGSVHRFANTGSRPMRLILTFVPAGIERFFQEVFEPVQDRSDPQPPITPQLLELLAQTAPQYGLEFLLPADGASRSASASG
jgi:quercetin dioxygenase-like cupin family protein